MISTDQILILQLSETQSCKSKKKKKKALRCFFKIYTLQS